MGFPELGALIIWKKVVSEKSFAVGFQNTAKEAASSPPQNAPKQACALPLRSRTLDLFSHLCRKWESSTCFAELGPEAPSHCSSSALYLQHAEHISSH